MNEMYNIIKNVINGKAYELTTMLTKIKTLWVEGDISDAQKEELVELARENAKPENSYAPLQNQIETIFENLKEMGSILNNVKERVVALEGGEVTPEEPTEEYPPYVQPSGAHDAYNTGDKMTYTDGDKYICQMDGCVWGPDVYPKGWKKVETE